MRLHSWCTWNRPGNKPRCDRRHRRHRHSSARGQPHWPERNHRPSTPQSSPKSNHPPQRHCALGVPRRSQTRDLLSPKYSQPPDGSPRRHCRSNGRPNSNRWTPNPPAPGLNHKLAHRDSPIGRRSHRSHRSLHPHRHTRNSTTRRRRDLHCRPSYPGNPAHPPSPSSPLPRGHSMR